MEIKFKVKEIAGEKYMEVDTFFIEDNETEGYVTHRRSKNYVAKLISPDPKFKFKRQFIKFKQFDNKHYIPIEFQEGDILEIRFIYFSGSGHAYPNLRGIFQFKGIQGEYAIFEKLSETEALDILSEKSTEEIITVKLTKEQLENFKKTIENAKKDNSEFASGFKAGIEYVLEELGLSKYVRDY